MINVDILCGKFHSIIFSAASVGGGANKAALRFVCVFVTVNEVSLADELARCTVNHLTTRAEAVAFVIKE